jgi:hypothetical protein
LPPQIDRCYAILSAETSIIPQSAAALGSKAETHVRLYMQVVTLVLLGRFADK